MVVDGKVRDLSGEITLDKNKKHDVLAVVDRLALKDGSRVRVAESVEAALHLGEGMVAVEDQEGRREIFSEEFACVSCAVSFPELSPRLFSFNSPYGACRTCGGLGYRPPGRIQYRCGVALRIDQYDETGSAPTKDAWLMKPTVAHPSSDLKSVFGLRRTAALNPAPYY